jgi:hypothetical protein
LTRVTHTRFSFNILFAGVSFNILFAGVSLNILFAGVSGNILFAGVSGNILFAGVSLNILFAGVSLTILFAGVLLNIRPCTAHINGSGQPYILITQYCSMDHAVTRIYLQLVHHTPELFVHVAESSLHMHERDIWMAAVGKQRKGI